MKKLLYIITAVSLCFFLFGCDNSTSAPILATTKPVYCFASALCEGTDLSVDLLITENVSCLHEYTLQVSQMRKVEVASIVIISGAGFEDFLDDVLPDHKPVVDASAGIEGLCHEHEENDGHHHEHDPHIWLSITNARTMAENIASALTDRYPQYADRFADNLDDLLLRFADLEQQSQALVALSHRDLITFHDGFAYLAEELDLQLVRSMEEESGSEASAKELIEIIEDIRLYDIPAIFTEVSGSASAAEIIRAETGVNVFILDMALSERDYFAAMEHNITTLKEALE